MSSSNDLERQLRSMLADTAPNREPETLYASVMGSTRNVRQRPGLLVVLRSGDVGTAPRTSFRLAAALAIGLLVVALVGAVVVGSQLLRRSEPLLVDSFEATPIDLVGDGTLQASQVFPLPDGRVLMIGRGTDGSTPFAAIYDPTTGAITQTGSPLSTHDIGTGTVLADGRILLAGSTPVIPADGVGRLGTAPNEIYDPVTGTFTETGAMVFARYGHTATLLDDGRVLIAGGDASALIDNAPTRSRSIELFDPSTGAFSAAGSMSAPRIYASAVRLDDGRVLITGGTNGDVQASAEIFDPATGASTPTGTMHIARAEHASVLLADRRVAVIGGGITKDGIFEGTASASIETFDPATGAFTEAGALTTERSRPLAMLLTDGRVLIVGGGNIDGWPRSFEIFDPVSGKTSIAGSLVEDMTVESNDPPSAVLLADGRIVVAVQSHGPQVLSGAKLPPIILEPASLEPASPAFTALDGGLLPRGRGAAILLDDGRVLLVGGLDPARGEAVPAQVFDPAAATAQLTDQLTTQRYNEGLAALPNGRRLVVGGELGETHSSDGTRLPAEVFDPASNTFSQTGIGGVSTIRPHSSSSRRASQVHATVLVDGRVLVSWPFQDGRYLAIYDPSTGAFSAGPDLVRDVGARSSWSCNGLVRMLDGRVFIPCSDGASLIVTADGARVTTVPGEGRWTDAVALADGRVLVVDADGQAAFFDPTNGQSKLAGRMGERRIDAEVVALADGQVLFIGGREVSTPRVGSSGAARPLRSVERFDPTTGEFTFVGLMHSARADHTATLLQDGRVLIVGRTRRSPDRTEPEPFPAEIFDPAAAQ